MNKKVVAALAADRPICNSWVPDPRSSRDHVGGHLHLGGDRLTESPSLNFDSLAPLGWDRTLEEAFTNLGLGLGRPARVSRVDRGRCTVLGPEPLRAESLHQLIATGDWVVVGPGPLAGDREVGAAVLPRRTAFVRERSGAESTAHG